MTSLSSHGAITLSKNKIYLEHTDGTPFFWLADTWWFGGTKRASIEDFKTLIKDRKEKGFTAIQIVVGIPPETDPFSEDAANSGGLPFNKDFSINKNYFDAIDTKIHLLIENDLVPCIVGGWGHHIDILGIEPIKRLWDELLKRYGNLPVIFCLCGEANLIMTPVPKFLQTENHRKEIITFFKKYKLFSFAKKIKQKILEYFFKKQEKQLLSKRINKWNEIAEYIEKHNKYHRLLTVHVGNNITANDLFHNPSWLAINTIQSGHGKDTVPFMVESIRNANKSKQPMINMEPWYEGILGNFDEYYQRVAFWLCILSGAKGHTYGAHGIWQMATKNDQFMNHWGASDWKKAINYKGAEQIGNAVAFLKKYEWWRLKPITELTTPQWSKANSFLPVAATIDETYIIYIPDIQSIQSKLTLHTDLTNQNLIGLQPDTMKKIQLKNTKNVIAIPDTLTKDMLIITFPLA